MSVSTPSRPTACLALADGTVFTGRGFGATGETTAELCFNTAMTGYQEIMTDPSYAGQVVTFTFPHVGNVGVNAEDDETAEPLPRAWSSSGIRPSQATGGRRNTFRTGWRGAGASRSAASTRAA